MLTNINTGNIDNKFLKEYLSSCSKILASSNTVICDEHDNILFATGSFLNTFPNTYQVGDKFINYKIPAGLSIHEEPIYSNFSGQLLCVKYQFNLLNCYGSNVHKLKQHSYYNEKQLPINHSFRLLKDRFKYLGYTDSDLNTLIIHIMTANIIVHKTPNKWLQIFDKQDCLIHEVSTLKDKSVMTFDVVDIKEIFSMDNGQYLGKIKQNSLLFNVLTINTQQ